MMGSFSFAMFCMIFCANILIYILSSIKNKESFASLPRVTLGRLCNQQNLPELLDLYDELKKINIFRWYIGQMWNFGRTKENDGLLEFADYDCMFAVYKQLIQKFHADGKPFQ